MQTSPSRIPKRLGKLNAARLSPFTAGSPQGQIQQREKSDRRSPLGSLRQDRAKPQTGSGSPLRQEHAKRDSTKSTNVVNPLIMPRFPLRQQLSKCNSTRSVTSLRQGSARSQTKPGSPSPQKGVKQDSLKSTKGAHKSSQIPQSNVDAERGLKNDAEQSICRSHLEVSAEEWRAKYEKEAADVADALKQNLKQAESIKEREKTISALCKQLEEQKTKDADTEARLKTITSAKSGQKKFAAEKNRLQADLTEKEEEAAKYRRQVDAKAKQVIELGKKIRGLENKASRVDDLEAQLANAKQEVGELTELATNKIPGLERENARIRNQLNATESEHSLCTPDSAFDIAQLDAKDARIKALEEKLQQCEAIEDANYALREADGHMIRTLEKKNKSLHRTSSDAVKFFNEQRDLIGVLKKKVRKLEKQAAEWDAVAEREQQWWDEKKRLDQQIAELNDAATRNKVHESAVQYWQDNASKLELQVVELKLWREAAEQVRSEEGVFDKASPNPGSWVRSHTSIDTTLAHSMSAITTSNGSTDTSRFLTPTISNKPSVSAISLNPDHPIFETNTFQPNTLQQDLNITITIDPQTRPNFALIHRLRSAITKTSNLHFDGPPELVKELDYKMREIEADHQEKLAKVKELRNLLWSQALESERQKKADCTTAAHRALMDENKALAERVDMQNTLLESWTVKAPQ